MNRESDIFFRLMYMIVLLFAIVCMAGRGCMAEEKNALIALQTAGYSDIKIVDRRNWLLVFTGCDASDAAAFYATVQPPGEKQDKPVDVLVCMGWPFKGATVRVP